MGGLLKTPKPPAIEPPDTMPDPDDEVAKQRNRTAAAAQSQDSGRSSTILSDGSNAGKLGS